ncbi:methyl-accepting chemotaxis protein [Vibrio tapetis subsp. quintayensis]|nr:methyl-accepting chemotaxis protein [Vibrio tapetis]MDN3680718.1 methyl-accepting chemotaxis protein [Vibrio tapetis subsp. quintayensis]
MKWTHSLSIKQKVLIPTIVIIALFSAMVFSAINNLNGLTPNQLANPNQAITEATQSLYVGLGVVIVISCICLFLMLSWVTLPIQQLHDTVATLNNDQLDLTKRVSVSSSDELGSVGSQINQLLDSMQSSMTQVIITSNSVRAEMENIRSLTQGIVMYVSSQQGNTDHISSSAIQVQSISDNVSHNAVNASAHSSEGIKQLDEATSLLNQTSSSLQTLESQIDQAGGVISNLDSNVTNIVTILGVIVEIAEQTNLLALNAAIEAARAGEQGRGFAVVADEVRALASKTQESTDKIQKMTDELRKATHEAVSAVNVSCKTSEETVQLSGLTLETLQSVTQSVTAVASSTLEIESSSEQQMQLASDVSNHMQTVLDGSYQMIEMVSSAENACEMLASQCEELDSLMIKFEV